MLQGKQGGGIREGWYDDSGALSTGWNRGSGRDDVVMTVVHWALHVTSFFSITHLIGTVVKCLPREQQTWVRSPVSPWIFLLGRVIPVTYKFVVASVPGAWHYRISAGTCWPGVSVLWLSEVAKLILDLYVTWFALHFHCAPLAQCIRLRRWFSCPSFPLVDDPPTKAEEHPLP